VEQRQVSDLVRGRGGGRISKTLWIFTLPRACLRVRSYALN